MSVPFFDDFEGPAGVVPNPSYWKFKLGTHGSELQNYTDKNAVLDGQGNLAITARKEASGTKQYSSSWVETSGTVEPLYGLLEARIKMPKGAGLWPAFWGVGNDHDLPGGTWPKCGEIDVTEVLCQDTLTTYGTLHGPKTDGSHWSQGGKGFVVPRPLYTAPPQSALHESFNVYGCLWERGRVRFLLNNVVIVDIPETAAWLPAGHVWVFDHPFWLILNLAVGGWAGTPDDSVFPATMLIDWVRVTPL